MTTRFPGELRFPSNELPVTAVNTWSTDELFTKDHSAGPRSHSNTYGGDPGLYKKKSVYTIVVYFLLYFIVHFYFLVYALEGFLSIQMLVCMEIIKSMVLTKTNNTKFVEPVILMGRFPYPPWKQETTSPVKRYMMSVYILVTYLFQLSMIVRDLTVEKQTQIKVIYRCLSLR